MKPVHIDLSRLPNVKAEEFLYLIKLVIFRNGKVRLKIHMSKIMFVKGMY